MTCWQVRTKAGKLDGIWPIVSFDRQSQSVLHYTCPVNRNACVRDCILWFPSVVDPANGPAGACPLHLFPALPMPGLALFWSRKGAGAGRRVKTVCPMGMLTTLLVPSACPRSSSVQGFAPPSPNGMSIHLYSI